MSRRLASNGAIAATALALLLLCASVLPYLRASTEAVRLRNALLFDRAGAGDFSWTPEQAPASFARDLGVPANPLAAATAALLTVPAESDWEKSLRIAGHLVRHAGPGGAAKADLLGTYQIILKGGGYCADFTTTFIAMAASAGIFAREWAFSFDGYGGHGHALIEVWDRGARQWRMLDVFNNFYAIDRDSGHPLSAQEFREHLASGRGEVNIQRIGPGRDGFNSREALYAYYRDGADQWYLWWGNAVYAYDASMASRVMGRLSRSAEQLTAIAEGVHPRIRAVPTATNAALRERALRLKWRLLATGSAGAALVLLLSAQLGLRWRARSRSNA